VEPTARALADADEQEHERHFDEHADNGGQGGSGVEAKEHDGRGNGDLMEDGMCLVLFQRPEEVQRGDFDEGTSHLALEVSPEDFDKATDELSKAGVKVLIDKPVVRPTGKAIYFFDTEQNYIQLWSRP
jgi:hypothetical protein